VLSKRSGRGLVNAFQSCSMAEGTGQRGNGGKHGHGLARAETATRTIWHEAGKVYARSRTAGWTGTHVLHSHGMITIGRGTSNLFPKGKLNAPWEFGIC